MPANIEELIPSLIRWGKAKGIRALETMAMGQWDSLIEQNGRQLVSSSVNGESFTYSFAPGLDVSTIISASDEACKRMFQMQEAGTLEAYLTTPIQRRTRVRFC